MKNQPEKRKFQPGIDANDWEEMKRRAGDREEFFSLLAEPLHEELYRRQSFEFIYHLNDAQQAVILLDYVRTQVLQGGFIQLIQNGYVGLLVPLVEALQKLMPEISLTRSLDDALKVYVLNREALDRETSVEDFAKLYDEFSEFDALDEAFADALPGTVEALNRYAVENPSKFFQVGGSASV